MSGWCMLQCYQPNDIEIYRYGLLLCKKTKSVKISRVLETCANKDGLIPVLVYEILSFLSIPELHRILSICKLWNLYIMKLLCDKQIALGKQIRKANNLCLNMNLVSDTGLVIQPFSMFTPTQQLLDDLDITSDRTDMYAELEMFTYMNKYVLEEDREKLRLLLNSITSLATRIFKTQEGDHIFGRVGNSCLAYRFCSESWLIKRQGCSWIGFDTHSGGEYYD